MLGDAALAFGLVAAAEFGDKSQLLCLWLGARHGAAPVALGACTAFLVLVAGGVLLGVGGAALLPSWLVSLLSGLAFLVFGALMLIADEDAAPELRLGARGVVSGTFALVMLAELGDKTQLATVALAATRDPIGVGLGAWLALSLLALAAAWLGSRWLTKLPVVWVQRVGAVGFLGVGAVTLAQLAWGA